MIKKIAEENCSEMCRVTDVRETAVNNSYEVLTLTKYTNNQDKFRY